MNIHTITQTLAINFVPFPLFIKVISKLLERGFEGFISNLNFMSGKAVIID